MAVSSCEALEVTDLPQYPKTIEPLELSELITLNERYHSENDDQLCSTLNEFGFTGFSPVLFENGINPCTQREIVRIELTEPDTLLEAAKRAVLYNQEFTLVSDTSDLEVIESLALEGCTICEGPQFNNVVIGWKYRFANQFISGTEVADSEITVFLDAHGVNRIWGNWFPEFEAPGLINIGFNQARDVMVGFEIDLEPITGVDSVFTVTEESITEQPFLKLVPFLNEGVLELRKTWNVPITYKGNEFEGWEANIDVIEGNLVRLGVLGLVEEDL